MKTCPKQSPDLREPFIVAIFYPYSQFCEIDISLLSLQKQPETAPNLFQRGVEYATYADSTPGALRNVVRAMPFLLRLLYVNIFTYLT